MLASDGDLQEPVALGTASLAGHLGLSKLFVFYDANKAQISGNTNGQILQTIKYLTVLIGMCKRSMVTSIIK